MGVKISLNLSIFRTPSKMVGSHQWRLAEGRWPVWDCLMNRTHPALSRTILATLVVVGAAAGAIAQDPEVVHYTCADGTKLQATFSPPGASMGSVKLVYAGSPSEMVLPQALSADGGRYTEGKIEFWIKWRGATLTRAGRSTTCRTSD
jgi:membrane-bound inhibitor of C-type lysozyme